MGFIETASDYVKHWFSKSDVVCLSECINLINETCYKELGLRKAISMIAGTLINAEFKTYEKNKEVRKNIYYNLNISPNINYNKYDFYFKLINKLIREQEVLVVLINNQFFIADSFGKQKFTLKDYIFKDIIIDEYSIKDMFKMSDVFYFRLTDQKIKSLVNSINNNYSKIIASAQNSYVQSKLRKVIVDFDATFNMKDGEDNGLQKLIDSIIKPFVEGERNVLTLPKGISLKHIDNKESLNGGSVTEIKEAGKEIFENVITVFNIPLDIAYGNKTELKEQKNYYMTNAIKPFATMIETEIKRKQYTKEQIKNGTYLKIDLSTSEYINSLEFADGLDKMFRIGFSHNYLRKKLGEQELQEEWANKGYVTKNYMNIEGGEEINE